MSIFGSSTLRNISVVLTFLFLLGLIETVAAQEPASGQKNESPHSIYTVWAGYSSQSVRLLGKTPDAQSRIMGFGFRKKIESHPYPFDIYYTVDFIPGITYNYPKRDEDNVRVQGHGLGISPIGFLFQPKNHRGIITPYLQTTGSLIIMSDNFPTDKSTRTNYTFDVDLGLNLKLGRHVALGLGYKFHHISNAETGVENPGLDSNFLFTYLNFY